jgi:hypothetical protein
MAQNLLTISQLDFDRQIHKISSKTLVKLLYEIYEFKWEYGKRFSPEQIGDIERKETKINKVLMDRGYLSQKDYKEYFEFLHKINRKTNRRTFLGGIKK